jgi:hypothetical protein
MDFAKTIKKIPYLQFKFSSGEFEPNISIYQKMHEKTQQCYQTTFFLCHAA